ncbi:MAG: nucleotidyltransferase domain-containing protein [Bacteriovoracaceae bacterium]|nr:nucleotidyltransferase domain-containing protein [Bacteriovoracaceae bacterium]
MVKKRVRQQVEKLKKLLTQHNFEYQSIILFGSYAQGLESKHSDIDLCIVVDNKKKEEIPELRSKLNGLVGINGLNMDIIVATIKDYENNLLSPLLHEVRKKGIKVA